MTWRPEVPADFAGETGKIRFDAQRYCRGVGLDVGCGPWKVFPTAIGLDGAPHGGAGGPSLCLDCTDLSMFADKKFDYVFSSHFLEHVHDTAAMLAEWWRVIKVGGHLVMYLPHKKFYPNIGQYGANADHKHDFLPDDIVKLMREMQGKGWDLLENEERSHDYEYSFFQVYRKRADKSFNVIARDPAIKHAAVCRPGNFGDSVWATSIAAGLKQQGYHVTAYVEPAGEAMMLHNPNVDDIVVLERQMFWQPGDFLNYLESQRRKFDKFVNFTQTVESTLLFTPDQPPYHWPHAVRKARCAVNYVEAMHQVAEVPYVLKQQVFNTEEETIWAQKQRKEFPGRVIVLANTGSTAPKWWPYAPAFCQIMAAIGVHVFVVGDLKGLEYTESTYTHVVDQSKWTIRQSVAFAKVADAVVGQETGLLNAVAIEAVAKVVLLGHSTVENLTRDWFNTQSLSGDVGCYPCHRIHFNHDHCPQEERSKAAQCQAAIKIEAVVEALVALNVLTVADVETLKKPQPIVLHRKAA